MRSRDTKPSIATRFSESCLWLLAWWLALRSSALAQSTGGSVGGSDWGSSGSSGGGGGSSSGGWSGGSGSSYDTGGASNAYEPPFWAQLLIMVAFLAFLFFLFRGLGRLSQPPKVHVSRVRVALDARARRFVQEALTKLAARSDTKTREGLAALLRETTRALVASRAAWIYCGVEQLAPMLAAEARVEHTKLAQDARARFQHELVRNAEGLTRREETPALVAREHEGEGAVIVSIVLASRARLRPASASQADEVARLLGDLGALEAIDVIALEVIWSPAAEEDRMSTDELEARYPELTRLTAIGGRVYCEHCHGPYTAELARCPHCGAPSASAG
ncbi:MAG: DUF1517 domain-containing protein [Sandaracinus sp.]